MKEASCYSHKQKENRKRKQKLVYVSEGEKKQIFIKFNNRQEGPVHPRLMCLQLPVETVHVTELPLQPMAKLSFPLKVEFKAFN